MTDFPNVDRRNRALEWLRPSRLSEVHDIAKAACEPTTGNWFIHGEEFKSWRQGEPSLLWLHESRKFLKLLKLSVVMSNVKANQDLECKS